MEREEAKGNLFGVVKRMASRNKDVVGGGGVKDKEGKVQVENSRMLEVYSYLFFALFCSILLSFV